ncbi:MAG: RseA family anti-sigma factor [Pseudomonadota bacterium]
MSQKLENLSAAVDGELDDTSDLGGFATDPAATMKWKRYHLARDILRGDDSSDYAFSVSDRVAKALEQELPIVAPKHTWKEIPLVAAVIPIFKQTSQLAAAACVTALVIFSYQSFNQPEETQPFTSAPSPFGPIGGLSPVNLEQNNAISDQARMQQLLEQRRQLNALIEDHERQLRLKQAIQKQREQTQSNQ